MSYLADKCIDKTVIPFNVSGQEIIITTSIGIAIQDENTDSAESLMENAITAMHKAKEKGRNSYLFEELDLMSVMKIYSKLFSVVAEI